MANVPSGESALIAVDIDLSSVIRKVQQSGDITKKEAKEIEQALIKAYQAAAKAAEEAAKAAAKAQTKAAKDALREQRRIQRETEASYREQASAVRGLFSAVLGGVGGDLLDLVDATDGVSDSMAALGVALGTLAIGPVLLSGIAQGLIELADAGVEARESLEEADVAVDKLISPTALAALDEYEEHARLTEQATQALAIEMSAAASTDAAFFADAMLGTRQAATEATSAFSGAFQAVGEMSVALMESQPLGFMFVKFLRDAGEEAGRTKAEIALLAEEQKRQIKETKRYIAEFADTEREMLLALGMVSDVMSETSELEMLRALGMVSGETAKATQAADEHAKALDKTAEAADKHAKTQRKATQAADEHAKALDKTAEAADKLDYDALAEAMGGLTIDTGLTWEASRQLTLELAEQAAQLEEETIPLLAQLRDGFLKGAGAALEVASAVSPILANVERLSAAQQRQSEDRIRQLRDERAESRDTYQQAVADFKSSQDQMSEAEAAAQAEYLRRLKQSEDAKREQLRAIEQEEAQAVRQAFKRQQSLQIAQATIDAARNAVVLTGSLAFLNFGAPVVATKLALGQLATQIAVIKAQQPPTFHFGTSAAATGGARGPVDIPGRGFMARLEEGEGVISRRGMGTPGAQAIVAALNSGLQPLDSPAVHIGDMAADALTARQNRPYAPSVRGRGMAGRNTFFRGY